MTNTLNRLDEEIEKIRLLYLSYEGEMKVNIKSIFDKKVLINTNETMNETNDVID